MVSALNHDRIPSSRSMFGRRLASDESDAQEEGEGGGKRRRRAQQKPSGAKKCGSSDSAAEKEVGGPLQGTPLQGTPCSRITLVPASFLLGLGWLHHHSLLGPITPPRFRLSPHHARPLPLPIPPRPSPPLPGSPEGDPVAQGSACRGHQRRP